jgi:predicted Zn-dependent protease
MRRSFPLLVPIYLGAALVGVHGTAHPTTPVAAVADMTTVARPSRARWDRRVERPVRVFIAPGRSTAGWHPDLIDAVWDSFRRWSTQGVPVRFARVTSPSAADVVVEWVESLPGSCIGKTWRQDVDGEISTARITLALHDHRGRLLTADMQRGAALHEIGHLLGLEHVGHRDSIMYPQVWVTDISAGDRTALRDLYVKRSHATAD